VDKLPVTRQEGQMTIYPVVKEVLVVQKRLLLIEEIRVTRQQTQTQDTQTVRLRREEMTVERTPTTPERPA
jgi:stress response protein YsnF